jgi:membrane protein required for colicin V production
VSQFDLIVIMLLAVSGLIGCLRGAVREVMTVLAFLIAVVTAVFSLKVSGPILRHWVHTPWMANIAAALVVFVAVYLLARILGARLVHNVRRLDSLSLLDRVVGLGFGLIRGLVLLGVFQLAFHAATPAERMPNWITGAQLYPLAVDSGRALRLLAPQGSAVADKLAPSLEHAVAETSTPSSDEPVEKPH